MAGAAGVAVAVSLALSRGGAAEPLTVRALLQSDEVADATTRNLLTLHGEALAPMGHAAVRERVAAGLARVDAALEQLHPEAHRQLSELQLGSKEKAAAVRSLQAFGDARMVAASRAVLEEFRGGAAGLDDAALERRLKDRLQANFPDLASFSEEFPARRPAPFGATGTEPRRLEASDSVSAGVNAHAHALFRSLEEALGESMPKAPARMLQTTTQQSGSSSGNTSFMGCLKDAIPDPSKVVSCFVQNIQEVMSMMSGKVKQLTSR